MRWSARGLQVKKRTVILICFLLIITGYVVYLYFFQWVHVTEYAIDTKGFTVPGILREQKDNKESGSTIRIVQLTDLHDAEFGRDNKKLVKLVAGQKPDIIIMTGDMINRDDPNLNIVKNLISQLSEIAPVYFGYGNHENTWEKNYGKVLHKELSEAGAVVLNDEYVDVEINDVKVRIGGFRGYYGFTHMDGQDEEQKVIDQQFFDDFINTDRYRILLNHIPTQWVDWNHIDDWNTGLVFCGHYHGGQIVLPFVGPLYAPYVGWFPQNVRGCYVGKESTCILSSGLGDERWWLPRVNNPPEIVMVDLY